MNSIFHALKNGDAKERIAVIADIATLAGISLATITGGVLTLANSAQSFNVSNIIGAIVTALLGLILVLFLTICFSWLVAPDAPPEQEITTISKSSRLNKTLWKIILWIVFFLFQFLAVITTYQIIASFNFQS